jgi:hypothetical protein
MLAEKMFQAALVEWIGSQADAKAPRDIVAWAVDKDLMEPAIQSMEVRLLINKRQLDSLNTVLSEVMAAGRRGQIGGEDFFSALQATAASAARTPDQIRNARSLVAGHRAAQRVHDGRLGRSVGLRGNLVRLRFDGQL